MITCSIFRISVHLFKENQTRSYVLREDMSFDEEAKNFYGGSISSWSPNSLALDGTCRNFVIFLGREFVLFCSHLSLLSVEACRFDSWFKVIMLVSRLTDRCINWSFSMIDLKLLVMFHFNLERNPPCEMLEPLVKYSLEHKAECDNFGSNNKNAFSHSEVFSLISPIIIFFFKLEYHLHRKLRKNKRV